MTTSEGYISGDDNLERLAKLETKVCLKFAELDKALVLAAEKTKEEKIYTRDQIADHFKLVNNFQSRIDKMVESFATKEDMNNKFTQMYRLLWIGIGIVMATEVFMRFIK